MQSPKKAKKTSPVKQMKVVTEELTLVHTEKQQQQYQLAENEVEMERMKSTLGILSSKLEAHEDIQAQMNQYMVSWETSESARKNELQAQIEQDAKNVIVESTTYTKELTNRTSNISDLQNQLTATKAEMAKQKQLQLEELERVNLAHKQQLDKLVAEMKAQDNKHDSEMKNEKDAAMDRLSSEQRQHAAVLSKRDSDHNATLKELERLKAKREQEVLDEVRRLTDKFEEDVHRLRDEIKEENERHDREKEEWQRRTAEEIRRLNDDHNGEVRRLKEDMRNQAARHDQERRDQEDKHERELRAFRDEQERKDQENRRNIENLRAEHATAVRTEQERHDRENRAREEKYKRELDEFAALMKQKLDEVNQAHENTRAAKDLEIRNLNIQMETMRAQFTAEINQLKITISTLQTEVLGLKSKIVSLEELLAKKADVERQLERAVATDQEHADAREKLRQQLGLATDASIELEEKCYKAQRTSLELLKQLKDSEVEIETLKQYIIDLKQRIAVYIPVKEDGIDKKLAEYINNYPERSKLKIMFMRETEGVYQFGTKRVAVKVEKDNIKIRVGGGYLSIDEFLDQYTPVELEKLERKDPLKRFSEKVAIQKTIVAQGVREQSPVRVQTASGKRSKAL